MSNFDKKDKDYTPDIVIAAITMFFILFLWWMLSGCAANPMKEKVDCDWYCPVNGEIPQDCYCLNLDKSSR